MQKKGNSVVDPNFFIFHYRKSIRSHFLLIFIVKKKYSFGVPYFQIFKLEKRENFYRIDVHLLARRAGEEKQKLLWNGLKPYKISFPKSSLCFHIFIIGDAECTVP